MRNIRFSRVLALFSLAVLLTGCAGYQLQGVVIEGPTPGVQVVNSNDPRLAQPGVPEARIQAMLDPDKLRQIPLDVVTTDENGRFAIPVNEAGAGILEYSVSVYADAEGYGTAGKDVMPLPGPGKQLLVTLAAGRGRKPARTAPMKEDLAGEAEKVRKQYGIE